MDLLTLAAGLLSLGLALALVRRFGYQHPAFLLNCVWATAFILFAAFGPAIGLDSPSTASVALILLATVMFSFPALFARPPAPQGLEIRIHRPLLAVATLLVFSLTLVGYLAFAGTIGAAAGRSFSELSFTEIRYFQAGADRSGGGPVSLLYALAPLSASLFIVSGRHLSRIWFVGLVPVSVVALQSPGRTSSLTLLVVAVLFAGITGSTRNSMSPRISSIFVAIVVAIGIGYFIVVGALLQKDQVNPILSPPAWLPPALVSPILYLTGGISAFGFAHDNQLYATQSGRSVYAVLRIAEALGFSIRAPETIAEFVLIPVPFNVFTAIGDVWIDFGPLGVVAFSLSLGAGAHAAFIRARRGSLLHSWLTALAGSWVLSTPISFRTLYLDSLFLAIMGVLVFWGLQSRSGRVRRSPGEWVGTKHRGADAHLWVRP